jgi:hypothetical protein
MWNLGGIPFGILDGVRAKTPTFIKTCILNFELKKPKTFMTTSHHQTSTRCCSQVLVEIFNLVDESTYQSPWWSVGHFDTTSWISRPFCKHQLATEYWHTWVNFLKIWFICSQRNKPHQHEKICAVIKKTLKFNQRLGSNSTKKNIAWKHKMRST